MQLPTLNAVKKDVSKLLTAGLISLSPLVASISVPVTITAAGYSTSALAQIQTQAQAQTQLEETHTPQWVERYILQHHPSLLENSESDHVLAFYYFGHYENFTVFGMERVKGDDYESHNTVLIFENAMLQGYYQRLTVFPAGVNAQGEIFFPSNYPAIENIDLANGRYPSIRFKPELVRYKKGDLKTKPPHSYFNNVRASQR